MTVKRIISGEVLKYRTGLGICGDYETRSTGANYYTLTVPYKVTLPTRWSRALDAFDAGNILPRYIRKDYHELFSKCRREEEANYNAVIPDTDFEWFLRAV